MPEDTPTDHGGPDADEEIVANTDTPDQAAWPEIGNATDRIDDPTEFRRAVVDIGLVGARELDAVLAGLPPSASVGRLARVLEQTGRLTRYQAAAVRQRKGRGLFLGQYVVLERLGASDKGVIFKARHRRRGRVVALRVLPGAFSRDETAFRQFRRAFQAAGRVKHPNLVSALDIDEHHGVHFIVEEYVTGTDLDRLVLDRGQLPLAQALDITIQAARGLEAAHSRGIIHGDIRPSHLMLDQDGKVRVLDLGLAGILPAASAEVQTVGYVPPERQEDRRNADPRADIYSLGCTLFFLLTGREPFVDETVARRLLAHRERPAPVLRALRPDAPAELEDAYQRMMARSPADRPASMTEVIRLLEACRHGATEATVPDVVVPAPLSRPQNTQAGDTAETEAIAGRQRAETVFSRQDNRPGAPTAVDPEFEALMQDIRSEVPLAPGPGFSEPGRQPPRYAEPKPAFPALPRIPRSSGWPALVALGLMAAAIVAVVGFALFSAFHDRHEPAAAEPRSAAPAEIAATPVVPTRPAPQWIARTIFDGTSAQGWMLTGGRPLDRTHIARKGLNPHGTGSYLVVYREKLGDFILDFDYKLSEDCNTGVFLRVDDLNNPNNSGLEVDLVASSQTPGWESGSFNDLVPARTRPQKPTGEWNHMTITAVGPEISVVINGEDVSRINLAEWDTPGKRPDGSEHRFKAVAFARLPRRGYLGFQDLKGDCWFRAIVLKVPAGSSSR